MKYIVWPLNNATASKGNRTLSTAFKLDKAFEGSWSAYFSFVQAPFGANGDPRSFLIYRATTRKPFVSQRTMVASTVDGVHFERPESDITFQIGQETVAHENVLFYKGLPGFAVDNFFVMKDTNPASNIELRGVGGVDSSKITRLSRGIHGFHVLPKSDGNTVETCIRERRCTVSPQKRDRDCPGPSVLIYGDGILGQWVMDTPTLFTREDHPDNKLPESVFDGGSSALWDPVRQRYILWVRTNSAKGQRRTHYSTSKDFKMWSKLRPITYPQLDKDMGNMSCYMMNGAVLEDTHYMVAIPQVCFLIPFLHFPSLPFPFLSSLIIPLRSSVLY